MGVLTYSSWQRNKFFSKNILTRARCSDAKMCVKCEGTNSICSLICRAILVVSTDERESVTLFWARSEFCVIKRNLFCMCVTEGDISVFFKEYTWGSNHKSEANSVESSESNLQKDIVHYARGCLPFGRSRCPGGHEHCVVHVVGHWFRLTKRQD